MSFLKALKRRADRLVKSPAGPRKDPSRPVEFVVFCDARTGSYNLVNRLNSCADVVCHGEIFKKNGIEVSKLHRRRLTVRDTRTRDTDPVAFIRELRALNPARHFGFKIFSVHLGWAPGAADYLTAPTPGASSCCARRSRATPRGSACRKPGPIRPGPGTARRPAEEPVHFAAKSFETFAQHYNRHVDMAACWRRCPAAS